MAVAYRAAVAARPVANTVHAGLVGQVEDRAVAYRALQRQDDDLRRQVSTAQRNLLGGSSDELTRIRQQEAATGLAAVTGPGRWCGSPTRGRRSTRPPARPSTADVNRILDVDLQSVVNALWAGGAEAIAINGQRLTATSTIRTAGNAILVDFRPLASPYDVSAIGPGDLDRRFNASAAAASMRGLVQQYGLGFAVQPAGRPAATGRDRPDAEIRAPARVSGAIALG